MKEKEPVQQSLWEELFTEHPQDLNRFDANSLQEPTPGEGLRPETKLRGRGRPTGAKGKLQTAEEFIATTEDKSVTDKSFLVDVGQTEQEAKTQVLQTPESQERLVGQIVIALTRILLAEVFTGQQTTKEDSVSGEA